MFEVVLAVGITPVFLIFGVIPGIVFVVAMLVAVLLESGGVIGAVKAGMREQKAKQEAFEITDAAEPPEDDTVALDNAVKLFAHASIMHTDPQTMSFFRRTASLMHIDAWPIWAAKQRAIVAEISLEEGVESEQVKQLLAKLSAVAAGPEYENESTANDFVLQINALLPVTTPLLIGQRVARKTTAAAPRPMNESGSGAGGSGKPGTMRSTHALLTYATEDDALKMENAVEESLSRFSDWPAPAMAEMHARAALMWLCVRSGAENKTIAREALKSAKLYAVQALEEDDSCPLALLCRARVCKESGESADEAELLYQFALDPTCEGRRDFPGACYEAADVMYRIAVSEGEGNVGDNVLERVRELVERGAEAEKKFGKKWAEMGLPHIVDVTKRSLVQRLC